MSELEPGVVYGDSDWGFEQVAFLAPIVPIALVITALLIVAFSGRAGLRRVLPWMIGLPVVTYLVGGVYIILRIHFACAMHGACP